jgi:hypothetical protein
VRNLGDGGTSDHDIRRFGISSSPYPVSDFVSQSTTETWVSPKFGSKLPLTLTVTETGEPPICPESVALLLPDHLFEFAWVTGRCRRLPLGRNSPKLAMQRLDSIHLDCETSIAPVAKRRRKSLNVPMSLTEDAEAKAKKDGCLFSKQDNETMLSNQITCGKWTI